MKTQIPLLMKGGLTASDLRLLSEVIAVYGYKFSVSYRQIGTETNMSYESVRYHFKKLEMVGLIAIEHSSTRKLVCSIDKRKLKGVF